MFKKNSADDQTGHPGHRDARHFRRQSIPNPARESLPEIKILIASGYGKEYLETTIFKSKISHFLPKPFKIEQLSYQVNQLLGDNNV